MPGSVRQWTLVALVKKTSFDCWKTTDGLARAGYNMTWQRYCVFITPIELYWIAFINKYFNMVAWLFDHPVEGIVFTSSFLPQCGSKKCDGKKVKAFLKMSRIYSTRGPPFEEHFCIVRRGKEPRILYLDTIWRWIFGFIIRQCSLQEKNRYPLNIPIKMREIVPDSLQQCAKNTVTLCFSLNVKYS
jgi:hypothetical protein